MIASHMHSDAPREGRMLSRTQPTISLRLCQGGAGETGWSSEAGASLRFRVTAVPAPVLKWKGAHHSRSNSGASLDSSHRDASQGPAAASQAAPSGPGSRPPCRESSRPSLRVSATPHPPVCLCSPPTPDCRSGYARVCVRTPLC